MALKEHKNVLEMKKKREISSFQQENNENLENRSVNILKSRLIGF